MVIGGEGGIQTHSRRQCYSGDPDTQKLHLVARVQLYFRKTALPWGVAGLPYPTRG